VLKYQPEILIAIIIVLTR